MTMLGRKLLRELWTARGQALAAALLVACAVATFVASMATWHALERSRLAYYRAYAFPDVFAELRRAPEPVARRLAELPGVAAVETRVTAIATIEVPGLGEPASALLRSLPDRGEPLLGKLHLRAGRTVAPGTRDEVVASEGFAGANGLAPGSRLVAVIDGRRQVLRVVGIALSPEYVFVLPPGGIMPDDRHYGVLWMAREGLAAALDLTGAFDAVALRLAPGAPAAPVVEGVDRVLAPWGGLGAYGRDRHPSHRFVSDEIAQLRALAATVPTVFLLVAAFLIGVVLSRLVAAQRMQLGTLKALGYGDAVVGAHYALFAVVIVLAGAAVGAVAGFALGAQLAGVYALYYRFPDLLYRADPAAAAVATALALAAGLVGVAGAVRRAVRLAPAEAMRPEPPPSFRAGALERLGLARLLSPAGRMVLRQVARRPWRTVLSAAGIAAAVGTMVVASFTGDAARLVVDLYFDAAAREDVTVAFTREVPASAVRELRGLPGVTAAEGFRTVPVTLRAGHRSYRTALLGLEPAARLHRVVDAEGGVVPVPDEGVLLSARLAAALRARPGDVLRAEVLDGARPVRPLRVAGTVDDLLGVQATMALPALHRLLGEGRLVSGAWLSADPAVAATLHARLAARPEVASVSLRAAALGSLRRMLSDSLLWFTALLTGFAVVIAAGVVYNAVRVALAERERELATLRVIGFTRLETWRLVAGEVALEVGLAVPLGWAIGAAFTWLTARATASELMRLPAVVTPANCALAALVVVAAAVAVAAHALRWLARLDLVSVLKAKE